MTSKIGVFCPTLNVYGGGEYVAIAIANTLAQQNREVCTLLCRQNKPASHPKLLRRTAQPKHQNPSATHQLCPPRFSRLLPNHNSLLHRQKQMPGLYRRLLKLRLPLDPSQLHTLSLP